MNAFAEITRFGDRQFYLDWWNCTSWAQYYRKWNVVVHNFLYRHIYIEALTAKFGKDAAMWATFIISAIMHEYIIAISFRFYRPILIFIFLFPGVLFIYLTKFYKGRRIWNIFMWAMLLFGQGTLAALYARAYHRVFVLGHDPWDWMSSIF